MSDNREKDVESYISDFRSRLTAVVGGAFGSSCRATVRFFKYLPWRIKSYIRSKYKEYTNRPPRKDVNKVYVLVGYTTKESVDAKYNEERQLIIIRRGLMILILIMLIFISVDRLLNITDFDEISHVFGINSIEDITENDPFKIDNLAIETTETSSTKIPLSTQQDARN